jgi:hypothetical protein
MNARLPADSPSVGGASTRKKGSPAKNPARANNSTNEIVCPYGCGRSFRRSALVSHLNSAHPGGTNCTRPLETAQCRLSQASIALCKCMVFAKATTDVNGDTIPHGNHKCRTDPNAPGGKAKAALAQAGKPTGTRSQNARLQEPGCATGRTTATAAHRLGAHRPHSPSRRQSATAGTDPEPWTSAGDPDDQPGSPSSQGDLCPTDAEASPRHTPKAKPQKQRGSRGKGKGSKRSGQALKVGLGPHEIQGLTGRGAFEHHKDSLPGMNPTPRCAG